MQLTWLLLSIAVGSKPYITKHKETPKEQWAHSHVKIMTGERWRECFDASCIEVKIKQNQLTVQQSGMKMYAQTGSWLELQNDSALPSRCDLFAVPLDFTPSGTLTDSIEALKTQRKSFAIAELHGGNQLSVKIESVEGMKGSSSNSVPSLLLLVGLVSLVLFILVRQ